MMSNDKFMNLMLPKLNVLLLLKDVNSSKASGTDCPWNCIKKKAQSLTEPLTLNITYLIGCILEYGIKCMVNDLFLFYKLVY